MTRLTEIAFPKDVKSSLQQNYTDTRHPQVPVALSDDTVPQITELATKAIQSSPAIRSSEVLGVRSFGKHLYCVTKRGDIYRLTDDRMHSFGSTTVLSGAGNETATRIVTLHLGGAIWRADWQEGWRWTQLASAPADAKQISMSPDGKQLLLTGGSGSSLLLSSETGQPIEQSAELNDARLAAWNRVGSKLAVVDRSGSIKIVEAGKSRELAKLRANIVADQIGFFDEAWTGDKPATQWVVVRTGQSLQFFQVEGQKTAELRLPEGVTTVEPSPTEGILAVGGQGTLAIYFCAPSLDEPGRELFSLTGHSGSKIRCLHFTSDGKTLISTDNSHRQMSWLSSQP